jgi:hypothetical protein
MAARMAVMPWAVAESRQLLSRAKTPAGLGIGAEESTVRGEVTRQ